MTEDVIVTAIKRLIDAGYDENVKDLCRDIGRFFYAGFAKEDLSRRCKYACESVTELNRLHKKVFGTFITPKYGDTEKEKKEFILILISNVIEIFKNQEEEEI
jgi:hypothetical protein